MKTTFIARTHRPLAVLGVLILLSLAGGNRAFCGESSSPRSKEALAALSPDAVLERLKNGNERFVEDKARNRDHPHDVKITSKGQYPIAAVLSCMDSRVPTTIVFDQGIGDLFTVAVAGNVANRDILGSLEYACGVVGSKVVLVLGHTECGAVKGAIDGVELGNLTDLLEKIEPAVEKVPNNVQPRTSKNKTFVDAVALANVRHTIRVIREESSILRDLEKQGKIKIVGGLYDVATGHVQFL